MPAAILSPRCKLPLHIVFAFLTIAAMGLSVPRLFMKGQPRTRANTIALGMGAKSLIFLAYQLLTDHVSAFRRWRSLKAYFILNALEVVFWGAVAVLVIQANLAVCVGVGCTLSWVVVGLAVCLNLLAVWVSGISWFAWRAEKSAVKSGLQGQRRIDSRESEGEMVVRGSEWPKSRV